jgi:hypothetical protein
MLHLDKFGQRSLDRLLDEEKGSLTTAVRTAALYYLSERDPERPAWRAPRFQRNRAPSPGLPVAFDDETWEALEAEARRQRVEPAELAAHALFFYLSDFASGRLADLLGDRLRDDG